MSMVSLNSVTAYSSFYRTDKTIGALSGYERNNGSLYYDAQERDDRRKAANESLKQSDRVRKLLRSLNQSCESEKSYTASKTDSFTELLGTGETGDDNEEIVKPVVYNYKEVASKIQQAKTSQGAAQAVIAAKRKVMEMKRKISAGEGDPEELQLALTHAKRMEMAARKKKNHLELEEMAGNSVKRTERKDKLEEAAAELKSSLVEAEELKVSGLEDEILEKRQDMIGEAVEEGQEMTDEALADLNEMISEFGEEELETLEEAMEMLETMEVIDPHMDREELEELKRKHRLAEQKAIVKADMDYLRDLINHQTSADISAPGMSVPEGAAIDLLA